MNSSEIRQKFIQYFQKQNHQLVASSSLIPENDPSLLFANAGMNQFKNTFLGLETRDYKRAVSIQKCVRAGGKHNDLENVGFTARHHTFFEMMGNFSFGDYFKKEAIHFAWEFLTKELQIPKEKLYVTVFETDDDAAEIWHKQEGVPKERIFRFGEKDNFWRMGDTGPCGPCSEIFYDHGPGSGKESDPYKGIASGEDRFIEIWNLVFMQFFEKSPGVMEPLPKPSVDTGAGFERLVAALQGKYANYDTDLFAPMMEKATKISGHAYVTDITQLSKSDELREHTSCFRVLADHSRSVGFLIADGALPANEGRGYVLRRIIRRAIRYGQKLNPKGSIFPEMIESMIDHMSSHYPELSQKKNFILSTVREEQERFLTTLDHGNSLLNEELEKLKSKKQKTLDGKIVFKLYDTFGFPADLTELICREKGFSIDESGFHKEMDLAKQKAKSSWKGRGIEASEAHLISWTQEILHKNSPTKFVGYSTLQHNSKILGLSNGKSTVRSLKTGETGYLVLAETPFYAESGGQVGDRGQIIALNSQTQEPSKAQVQVYDCKKISDLFVHTVEVTQGELQLTDAITAEVSESLRRNTMANHSATHLLHAALRKVLGTHVTQAGSLVDETKTRFDFTHNKPLTTDEVSQIEDLVNQQIDLALPVSAQLKTYKDAVSGGAMALFGEKYGDEVRVLTMGNFSCELCGGTHVQNTSDIRTFKIVSETGVSAGVRRIEALAGKSALNYLFQNMNENQEARKHAGIQESWMQYLENPTSLTEWIENKKSEIKNLEKEIHSLKKGAIDVDKILTQAKPLSEKLIGSTANPKKSGWIISQIETSEREILSETADRLRDKLSAGIVILIGQASESTQGLPLIVSVTKDLSTKTPAGTLLKKVTQVMGGKGGGRPDFAQGSANEISQLAQAEKEVSDFLQSLT